MLKLSLLVTDIKGVGDRSEYLSVGKPVNCKS